MFPSPRSRRLVLALAATSLAVAPATAAAMPAGPDAPSGRTSTTLQAPLAQPPAPGTDSLRAGGDDLEVVLATGAFVVLTAGGVAVAYRRTPAPRARLTAGR